MTDWKMSWLCGFEMSYTSMQYNSGSNSKVYGVFASKVCPKRNVDWTLVLKRWIKKDSKITVKIYDI